jgi:tRNA A-37 threonylcarbamoyl transferase component Bud32
VTPSPDDQDILDVLDEYLAHLQAGETAEREKLLRSRPELASALEVLETLERVAPSPEEDQGAAERPPPLPSEGQDGVPPSGRPSGLGGLPRAFGQYELLSEIGRGGMGVVYKARQVELDRIVAIKMILASHLASPEHVRRFHAEAKAAARVQHSNIVHIHDVGQVHGQHYFAMEYIEGESLAERIAQNPIDLGFAVRLLAAVARAVDHLHRQGIVHRDLKPLNILLDTTGEPYLTDFGLAKVFAPDSEITATGVIAGSPPYMAPEQAAGRTGEVGPATDVYSLGAILYELLTGRPPFRQDNPLDTLMEVLSREPMLPRRLNPRVPRELELICLKCLAKSPGDRYSSAGALADDLERYARGEALEVRPPSLGQRLWSWTRRQPALALRLAALGLFYISFLVVEALRHQYGFGEDPATVAFHLKILAVLAVWTTASIVCQRLYDSQRWSIPARFLWGALDSLLLLAVLLVADGVASPLVVGYPLLIVGSGLWFRVRFVWFMTALSVVSYGILTLDFYWTPLDLRPTFDPDVDRHVINILGLLVLGVAVAYLVHRLRTLSSFYRRQAP